MEYAFYAEQIYRLKEGIVQARVLPAQEAEALGYSGMILCIPCGLPGLLRF